MTMPHCVRTSVISATRADCVRLLLLVLAAVSMAGCAGRTTYDDPLAIVRNPGEMPFAHRRALEQLDERGMEDQAYAAALHRMIWYPGYTMAMRSAAFDRLLEADPQGLQRTIGEYLPRMAAWEARKHYCGVIAERGWHDLSAALALSWSQQVVFVTHDRERPEYLALAALHGEDQVVDHLFTLLRTRNRPADAGLRSRLFELLHRIGERDRLRDLLLATEPDAGDLFLTDLRASLLEFGVLPHNTEEVLWLRRLREPVRAPFWESLGSALSDVSPARRADLELRDFAVVVAAHRHRPDLLQASRSDLYASLEARLSGARHYSRHDNFNNANPTGRERLRDHAGALTFGDLAAMHLALDAMEVPQVRSHLFDFADRDLVDRTTEYGGIITLDERGRFEVLEFPPQRREHDRKFIASQDMIDAGYTGLFHFHFHAQQYDNAAFAGPGHGDFVYADNLRANCLVLTFVSRDRMNVDFFRHGRVTVDLGEIRRPVR